MCSQRPTQYVPPKRFQLYFKPDLTRSTATMNQTTIACHAPVRSKVALYKVITIVFFTLSTFSVAVRFASVFTNQKPFTPDDWVIISVLVRTALGHRIHKYLLMLLLDFEYNYHRNSSWRTRYLIPSS